MARVEWVKARLDNWARWKVSQRSGSLGWATQSAFLNDPPGGERQAKIPIDEIEASVTDEAVESLRDERPFLYQAVQCVHALGMGVKATARRCECSESNIKALLDAADRVLAAWFTTRAEKQAALREAIKRSFTA
jgi:hypothetical protein